MKYDILKVKLFIYLKTVVSLNFFFLHNTEYWYKNKFNYKYI